MNSLFGIFFRTGHISSHAAINAMLEQMVVCETEKYDIWSDDFCGMGKVTRDGLSVKHDLSGQHESGNAGMVFIFTGRIDNRTEIGSALGLPSAVLMKMNDSCLLQKAYEKWGEHCPERVYGDWSFVAWHPEERRLFLARDHFGITSLYYYIDQNIFVFATSRQAILALKFFPLELDELYLAQILTSWIPEGSRTIYSSLRRLPPAHILTVSPEHFDIRQYWYLENTPTLHLSTRNEYADAFCKLFDDAVLSRLRTKSCSDGVAATLSGGLDSSSVTATAAKYLGHDGRRLSAYTSVPLADTACYVKNRFGDEFPLAESTARFAGNVDVTAIDAAGLSPIQAIRKMLPICDEPLHSAGNLFWMMELWKAAGADGNKVLLLGQFGNAGVSWAGDVFSQSMPFQVRSLGWRKWAKETLKRKLPPEIMTRWRRYRINPQQNYRASAILPAFAERLNLLERRIADPYEQPARTTLELRSFLQPGRSSGGALHAELGAAFGLDVRDPTADARLLAFTFAVPDHIFMDPENGIDRWLIREAMKGRVPDEVRLNRNRGRQAGDLVPRLRGCAHEVDNALNEIACGPAAEYVDVAHMRQVWQMIRTEDTPEAFHKSITILTRGIMAGLFVNNFHE
jgi:asparagine synthase (glutamine-hydrolysing)